jgi:hypothetical protein
MVTLSRASNMEVDGLLMRLAMGAGPYCCGRHSHPPNPAHAETALFRSGDGEHCSKFRSDQVLDGTSCGAKQQ